MNGELQIHSLPRSFVGDLAEIQFRAIKSWKSGEGSSNDIVLHGDDEEVAEYAKKLQVAHSPLIGCNEFGTPMLDSLIERIYARSDGRSTALIHSDVLFLTDLTEVVRTISKQFGSFLIIGRCREGSLAESREIEMGTLTENLQNAPLRSSVDYFVFRGQPWDTCRPLAVGRGNTDKWLIAEALLKDIPVIDVSSFVISIHLNHHYRYTKAGTELRIPLSLEGKRNLSLTEDVDTLELDRCSEFHFTRLGIERNLRFSKKVLRESLSAQRHCVLTRCCSQFHTEALRLYKIGMFKEGLALAARIQKLLENFPGLSLLFALGKIGEKDFQSANHFAGLALREPDFTESARALLDLISEELATSQQPPLRG